MFKWGKRKSPENQNADELRKAVEDLATQVKIQIDNAVTMIEELDQSKLYYLYVDTDETGIRQIKQQLNLVKKAMRWTPPNILITNKKLRELTRKELEQLIEVKSKLEVQKQ